MKKLLYILLLTANCSLLNAQGLTGLLGLLSESASALSSPSTLSIPDTIFVLAGEEENIFFENISLDTLDNYSITVNDSGTVNDSSWSWTPLVAGIYEQIITVGGYIDTFVVRVVDNQNLLATKVAFVMGDSKTAGISTRLASYDGVNGTVYYEENVGKTYLWYESDVSSPIVTSGNVDFQKILTDSSYTTPDYVVIRLSTNEMYASNESTYPANIHTALESADSIINSILGVSDSIKIALIQDTPPASAAIWDQAGTRDNMNRNMFWFRDSLINKYGVGGYSTNSQVFLLPFYTNCDIDLDFNNALHESTAGYTKESKTVYAWILHKEDYVSPFSFTDLTEAELSTEYTSDSIIVSGSIADKDISVTGGYYRVGLSGSFVNTAGTVSTGDTVWVQGTSSGSPSTAVNVVLTIGNANDTYSITTAGSSSYVLSFDGSTESLKHASVSGIIPAATDSLIIDVYYKPNATSTNQYVVSIGDYYPNFMGIRHNANNTAQTVVNGTNTKSITVANGAFSHVVWTIDFNNATSDIVVNGGAPVSHDGFTYPTMSNAFLGIGAYVNGTQFYGTVDIGEIKITRKNSAGTTLAYSYYTWDGTETTFIYDKGDAGNNLTSTNITLDDRTTESMP